MPDEFHRLLRDTGTLHVIAASGMNVTIVAAVLMMFLVKLFARRAAIILAILGIIFYCFLAGASPPVVRAAIMGTVAYVAGFLGRERDGLVILVGSAMLMLLVNPWYIFDIGWQLSFAATGGILWGYPLLQQSLGVLLGKLPRKASQRGKGRLREGVASELSVTFGGAIGDTANYCVPFWEFEFDFAHS